MTELRVAVVGVGLMGADDVARVEGTIAGARVAVVNDYLTEKAEHVAIAEPDVDAVVLATRVCTVGVESLTTGQPVTVIMINRGAIPGA